MTSISAVPGLEATLTDLIEVGHAVSHLELLMQAAEQVERVHDVAALHAEEGFNNEVSSSNVQHLVKPMNNALYHLDRAIGRELRRMRSLTTGLEVGASQLEGLFSVPNDLTGLDTEPPATDSFTAR